MAAAPPHVRAAPLARALRARASAAAAAAAAPPKPQSQENSRRALLGLSEPDLRQLALDLGQQSYRGKQLHDLLYKSRAKQIQEFNHGQALSFLHATCLLFCFPQTTQGPCAVPKAFREALLGAGWTVGRSPVHHAVTASDGTTKILLKLEDNRLIETVGIPVDDDNKGSSRLTACVSSQVGCPLRCSFCATGKGGFARNLQPHEIVEQVLAIEEMFKHRVTNVVFMGMGEPMLNLKSVLEAHRCFNKELKIGQRMMTISTVGVPNTIKMLASHKLQSTLAVSLHAPNQKLRETIVPSAKSYPLGALMDDCKSYFLETGRRVSFEYTLLAGINDEKEHAEELADLLRTCGGGYHVNLIPYNPIEGSEFKRPYRKVVQAFVDALEARKITVSVRQTRGLDANAACGQLRNEFQKNPLLESSTSEPNLVPV
ncbi:putative dual-specificity RNA methyltransferase RlmN [Panicum miliaceum]|uniref:Dual-specificity RNA methyltransferase RlmN n=1 Tax=Panicum miliaceum TaxID=4540 RepID=A0A3L6PPQ8_PANMI|nr:putative dual-specificity RNA methyltransferase RlmN [Panicum miliaceum]